MKVCFKKNRAVTLVELIIVITVLSLLITSLFVVFKNTLEAWKKSEVRLEVYQNARAVLDQMSRDIKMAIFDPAVGIHAKGYEKGSGIKPDSAGDEFYFIAPINPGAEEKSDLCEVGYWLDGSDNTLKKFYVTDDRKEKGFVEDAANFNYDFTTPAGRDNSYDLGLNVMDLGFKLHYRNTASTWASTGDANWDSSADNIGNYDANGNLKNPDGLPNGVEIEITVKNPTVITPAQEDLYVFSTFVCIPQAK